MHEHPILMSGPMVCAILEGRKTQTRRVMRPRPHECEGEWFWNNGRFVYGLPNQGELCTVALGIWGACPYGAPGDLLWCRETWAMGGNGPFYKATDSDGTVHIAWKPSIHMPRWASRLTLRITDVRVQRVQEITEEDAKAEGVDEWIPCRAITGLKGIRFGEGASRKATCLEHFAYLWDSINARRGYSWDSNPWVWAITFERLPTGRGA